MNEELWKPVVGYEGRYEVSTYGNVRSLLTKGRRYGQLLKPQLKKSGYLCVSLWSAAEARSCVRKIQHLVLEAFVGPRPKGFGCAHADGTRTNNHLANLRWATHDENMEDMKVHGTIPHGERHHAAKLTTACVEEIRWRRGNGEPLSVLASDYGVQKSAISRIVHGIRWARSLPRTPPAIGIVCGRATPTP